jgi:para-nitrobenzyl esterase
MGCTLKRVESARLAVPAKLWNDFTAMRLARFILISCALATALGAQSPPTFTDPARVEQGLVAGTAGRMPDVRVYRGIPYAAPPSGDLRWKPPQAPASWEGTRQAAEPGDACPQPPYPTNGLYGSAPPPIGEDCLNLNIWTPAKSANDRLPVMVWIHGGAFVHGTGAAIGYDGENLARHGVVVVTMNYRLGVFGLLALPELAAESPHRSAGDYAFLDQIAALRWVQRNIAAFGGDAARVTVFGESAGSGSVNVLMASPLAAGLFTRAIGESGGSFGPMRSLADAEKQSQQFAARAGVTRDVLKTLRAKSADELIKASVDDDIDVTVDGWLLPASVYSIFAEGKQNDVPIIVGSNANEGTIFPPPNGAITPAEFTANAQKNYGTFAADFLRTYPPGSTDADATAAYFAALRDGEIAWDMRLWARIATTTGHHRAYRYYFSRVPPGRGERLGAFHGSELAYVFGNFPYRISYQDADKQLAETIETYWANFARTGNPNGAGLTEWPAYDPSKDNVIDFDDPVSIRFKINSQGLDFFDDFNRSLRPSPELK